MRHRREKSRLQTIGILGPFLRLSQLSCLGHQLAIHAEHQILHPLALGDFALQRCIRLGQRGGSPGDPPFQFRVRPLQSTLGLVPRVHFDAQRREVRHRSGEALLVERPLAQRADVLVADDADDLFATADQCIEHRSDAKRFEIAGAKLVRPRIDTGVVRCDGAIFRERGKVLGKLFDPQLRPLGVTPGRMLEKIGAADGRAILVVEPDARAGGVERSCRDLSDDPERRRQVIAAQHGVSRLRSKRIVLHFQSAPSLKPDRLRLVRLPQSCREIRFALGHTPPFHP